MTRFLEVIQYYSYKNKINCTYEMVIRMRFADRLKFLLFGAGCIFRFKDEYELQKRKINLDEFRKWAEKQKIQESED